MIASLTYIEERLIDIIEIGVARGIVRAFDG